MNGRIFREKGKGKGRRVRHVCVVPHRGFTREYEPEFLWEASLGLDVMSCAYVSDTQCSARTDTH